MIGTLDPSHRKATVIGAGFSGLLASYTLHRAGYEVELIEAQARAGGLIATKKTPFGIAETAAHSFLATPPVTALCEDLGVELLPVNSNSRARFIYRGGRMRKMPLRPLEGLQALKRAIFAKSQAATTLEDWARIHLGKDAADYLLNPFVRGIYAARPSELGLEAAFPSLEVPSGYSLIGSAIFGKKKKKKRESKQMVAPKHGVEDLTQRLERFAVEHLGARYKTETPVSSLPSTPNTVLTVPAYAAAQLVRPHSAELAEALSSVRYAPLISITAFVPTRAFKTPIRGVGVLMPERESSRRSLGILFNSSAFQGRVSDPESYSSFTVMVGGTSQPSALKLSDAELRTLVDSELAEVLGATLPAGHMEIHRWPRAIPIYSPELPSVWKKARQSWCARPGHILFANYTGQVSLRGMIETVSAINL